MKIYMIIDGNNELCKNLDTGTQVWTRECNARKYYNRLAKYDKNLKLVEFDLSKLEPTILEEIK